MNYRQQCAEDVRRFIETGELPDAWEVDDTEFDRRVDEINWERELIEAGSVDSDHPLHPNHPITCVRPCCAQREP